MIERSLAPRTAVVIDMSLGERRAQPTEKRPTARVGSQRRTALTIELPQSIQLGVKRIGELMPDGGRSSDGNCGLRERRTIDVEESLPGGIAAQHTGMSQSQFRKTERAKKSSSLRSIRTVAGCHAIVDLFPDRSKYAAELLASKAALRPLGSDAKALGSRSGSSTAPGAEIAGDWSAAWMGSTRSPGCEEAVSTLIEDTALPGHRLLLKRGGGFYNGACRNRPSRIP